MATTLNERIKSTSGKPSGFDYMRLILAVLVICFHSVVTSYGPLAQNEFNQTFLGKTFGMILPMFFCLSGFLVAGSLMRSHSVVTFLGLRALRIYPALAIDAIFCGLILGPILTNLPLAEYFNHSDVHRYLLNSIGIIHYHLPGVFERNPTNAVNGQLWTIRYEMECYIALALLALLGLHRNRKIFTLIIGLILAIQQTRSLLQETPIWLGRQLVYCFLAGVVLFLWKDKIHWNKHLFIPALLLGFALQHSSLAYLASAPVAYATIYLGLLNPKKIKLIESGDYSYGLFLYGIPIQQTLVSLSPLARDWLMNCLLSIPTTFLFAWMSWHLVEKRVLRSKSGLYRLEKFIPENPLTNAFERIIGRRSAR